MSENVNPTDPASQETAEVVEPETGEEQPKPEIDWKAKAREWEKRAKENKSAQDELQKVRDASKTAEQKAAEREAAAEQRAAEAEARATRREVAIEYSLPKEDAELLDALTDEDAMRRFAERLSVKREDRLRNSNHVPNEGSNPRPEPDERRAFADFLTGR